MRRRWTRDQILAIIDIETHYGPLTYQLPAEVEYLFFLRTGIHRKSGIIYMAYWRYRKGDYDQLLEPRVIKQKEFSFMTNS